MIWKKTKAEKEIMFFTNCSKYKYMVFPIIWRRGDETGTPMTPQKNFLQLAIALFSHRPAERLLSVHTCFLHSPSTVNLLFLSLGLLRRGPRKGGREGGMHGGKVTSWVQLPFLLLLPGEKSPRAICE